jgi:molybdenum cofactor cytidylyltransferase
MGRITAIVLAAGLSERMGRPKLMLPFRGSTILRTTIDAVASSSVDHVVVVIGADVDHPVARPPLTFVTNPDPIRGNMSSLLTGVDADTKAAAFLLVAGDLPTIRTATIDRLVGLWKDRRPWAAVTQYRDRIAHPFLLSRGAVESVEATTGSKVLWRVLVESGDDRVVHMRDDADAPMDINTPADYAALSGSET